MIKWVSIAIVVVGGVFVVTLVPYLKGDVPPRARVVQTVSPAPTEKPAPTPAPTPMPTPSAPPLTPAPSDELAQATPSAMAQSGVQALLTGASDKASDGSDPAPTRAVVLALGAPDEEELPEGLVLAPMSPFSMDYELTSIIYPEGGMRMPALIQHDYKTPVATIGDRDISVWTSGCGADAISMVVAYYTGNTKQTPYTLFRWAAEHGLCKGSGLEHEALTSLASLYGIRGRWIEPDAEAILAALNAGQPVIAHMGRGVFTNSGHYVVLRGVAPDGTIYVNDPAVLENCFLTFPLDQIIKESKSDDPFMICVGPSV
jgi:hypothetical protein